MASARSALVALLVVVAPSVPGVSSDQVDDLRRSVNEPPRLQASAPRSPPPPSPTPPEKKDWHWDDPDCHDDDCDDEPSEDLGNSLLGLGLLAGGVAATSPVWVPGTLVDDGQKRNGWFTAFPYQHHDSYMTFEQPLAGDDEPWVPSSWSLRLDSDFGTNFDEQQLVEVHAQWEHVNRIGIETRLSFLKERGSGVFGANDFSNGGSSAAKVSRPLDSVFFGDLNGTYRFAQSRHWLFRGGLGLNWLADHGDEDFGFNATYQVDWFPHDPLVFSSEFDVGSLGDAWLFHFQQTGGVTWRGLEARVGYDYLDVGDAQFSMLLCGVRGWF
jgi:hypothetical protein